MTFDKPWINCRQGEKLQVMGRYSGVSAGLWVDKLWSGPDNRQIKY